jgi:hypothetical protein
MRQTFFGCSVPPGALRAVYIDVFGEACPTKSPLY